MNAYIKTYQCNAAICYDDADDNTFRVAYDIYWDGEEFDSAQEYANWITEKLSPIEGAANYDEIRGRLEIVTDYLRPE